MSRTSRAVVPLVVVIDNLPEFSMCQLLEVECQPAGRTYASYVGVPANWEAIHKVRQFGKVVRRITQQSCL